MRGSLPALVGLLILLLVWALPIAAAVWALLTLNRVKKGQDAMQAKLDAIERSLQRTP